MWQAIDIVCKYYECSISETVTSYTSCSSSASCRRCLTSHCGHRVFQRGSQVLLWRHVLPFQLTPLLLYGRPAAEEMAEVINSRKVSVHWATFVCRPRCYTQSPSVHCVEIVSQGMLEHLECLALSHSDAIGYNCRVGIACWHFLTWTHSNYTLQKIKVIWRPLPLNKRIHRH